MKAAKDYEKMFAASTSRGDTLKTFAESLANFEAARGIQPKRVFINGIVLDDVLSAKFEVPDAEVPGIVDFFLNVPQLDPDILINGIPGLSREVLINVGRTTRGR